MCALKRAGQRRANPTANSIEPPISGGKPAEANGDDEPKPPPSTNDANDESKVARLDQHRARGHGD
jgi:hypothetical protein